MKPLSPRSRLKGDPFLPNRFIFGDAIDQHGIEEYEYLVHTELSPQDIVKKALTIAGDICIYTNQNHVIETLD